MNKFRDESGPTEATAKYERPSVVLSNACQEGRCEYCSGADCDHECHREAPPSTGPAIQCGHGRIAGFPCEICGNEWWVMKQREAGTREASTGTSEGAEGSTLDNYRKSWQMFCDELGVPQTATNMEICDEIATLRARLAEVEREREYWHEQSRSWHSEFSEMVVIRDEFLARVGELTKRLGDLLRHCDAKPEGETQFERDVIAARAALQEGKQ